MPTGGSASTIFTVFEAEPQTPIPSRSLEVQFIIDEDKKSSSLVPWLCRGMPTGGSASTIFTVFEAEPQTRIPSRSLEVQFINNILSESGYPGFKDVQDVIF
jgi:hypothetical protein